MQPGSATARDAPREYRGTKRETAYRTWGREERKREREREKGRKTKEKRGKQVKRGERRSVVLVEQSNTETASRETRDWQKVCARVHRTGAVFLHVT